MSIGTNLERSDSTPRSLQWLDVLACPGDVMVNVAAQPTKHSNWIIPTLFLCAVSALCSTGQKPASGHEQELLKWQIEQVAIVITIGVTTFFGLLWSSFVLWGIARYVFKTKVHYFKAVEVVGLCGVILSLSAITASLLGILTDHPSDHLSPAILLNAASRNTTTLVRFDASYLFNLWIVSVLSIGLSKITKTDWKECILWTFSYWFFMRFLFA